MMNTCNHRRFDGVFSVKQGYVGLCGELVFFRSN